MKEKNPKIIKGLGLGAFGVASIGIETTVALAGTAVKVCGSVGNAVVNAVVNGVKDIFNMFKN